MRKIGWLLALAAALAGQGPAAAQDSGRDLVLRGPGATMACGDWLELRAAADGLFASSDREAFRGTLGWALGYLSGAARFGPGLNPLRQTDEDGAISWLVAHCRAHPELAFRGALDAFIETHRAR